MQKRLDILDPHYKRGQNLLEHVTEVAVCCFEEGTGAVREYN